MSYRIPRGARLHAAHNECGQFHPLAVTLGFTGERSSPGLAWVHRPRTAPGTSRRRPRRTAATSCSASNNEPATGSTPSRSPDAQQPMRRRVNDQCPGCAVGSTSFSSPRNIRTYCAPRKFTALMSMTNGSPTDLTWWTDRSSRSVLRASSSPATVSTIACRRVWTFHHAIRASTMYPLRKGSRRCC